MLCFAKSLQSCLTLCDAMDCSPPGSSLHVDSPGENTGVDCHFLLLEIFLTQGSNLHLLCLLHWQACSLLPAPIQHHWYNSHCCMLYIKLLRGNPEFSSQGKNIVSLILYLYEMVDVHYTCCGDHFMMYEVKSLYTLNLYSAVCQFHFRKIGIKTENKFSFINYPWDYIYTHVHRKNKDNNLNE